MVRRRVPPSSLTKAGTKYTYGQIDVQDRQQAVADRQ